MLNPLLVIDLAKARPKGVPNKKHKYLIRFMKPDGEWDYISPDDSDGKFLPDGKTFVLKPGVTYSAIINRKLLGGPTGETTEDGRPVAPAGKFLDYAVASDDEYTTATMLSAKYGTPHRYRANALWSERIGKYRVFAYPKVPIVARDADGKPTQFGGFILDGMHFHSSVLAAGYKLPKKILAFGVDSSEGEKVQIAYDVATQAAIPEGKVATTPLTVAEIVRPTSPEIHGIKVVPTHEPAPAVDVVTGDPVASTFDITLEQDADPLQVAAQMLDRMTSKKAAALGISRIKLSDFPAWARVKFRNEQELMDKLRDQPATTLLTLGMVKLTPHTKKLNKVLAEEWNRIVFNVARQNASGLSATKTWQDYEQADAIARAKWAKKRELDLKAGKEPKQFVSKVRTFRNDLSRDLTQEGMLALQQAAIKYTPNPNDPNDRFDRYAFSAISHTIRNRTAEEAAENDLILPLIEEGQEEAAIQEVKAKQPLSPKEAAELAQASAVALPLLREFLDDPSVPEAHRRVVASRLWLESPEEEARGIAARAAYESKMRHAAEAAGKPYAPTKTMELESWRRDWTGSRGIGLADNPVWEDPDTGEKVDFRTISADTQQRKLSKWYSAALARMFSKILVSEGTARHPERVDAAERAEWKNPAWRVVLETEFEKLSPEEKLVYAALGQAKKESFTLNEKGRALKRYLELETKLAAANRHRWMAAGHEREEDRSVRFIPPHAPPVIAKKPKLVTYVPHAPLLHPHEGTITSVPRIHHAPEIPPSVTFFTSSANQRLAEKLGINLKDIAGGDSTGGGVFGTPNISLGTRIQRHLDNAARHHKRLLELQHVSPAKLTSERKRHTERLAALDTIEKKHLPALHNAARDHVAIRLKLAAKQAKRKEIMEAHAMAQSAKIASVKVAEDALAAATTTAAKKAAKAALKAAQLAVDPKTLEKKLQPYQVSASEKKALEAASKKMQDAATEIQKHAPAIVAGYTSAVGKKVTDQDFNEAKLVLHTERQKPRQEIALLDHESERRAYLKKMSVTKSTDTVLSLIKAVFDYDFELGRLHAEVIA